MRVQKTRYEPIHIAFEKLDQPMIRIDPAAFLAAERLGWRKFLSSLYGGIFLQEDDFDSSGASRWRAHKQKLFCPKLLQETMDILLRSVSCDQPIRRAIKDFRLRRNARSLQLDITKSNHLFSRSHMFVL